MSTWDDFYGPNAGYALELYERYQQDPEAVDPQTRAFFQQLPPAAVQPPLSTNGKRSAVPVEPTDEEAVNRIVLAARLARSIREYGHLDAAIDPLGAPRPGDPMLDPRTHGISDDDLRALPASIVWVNAGPETGSCLDAIHRLCRIYCGTTGYDFDHVQNFEERTWLHATVESGSFSRDFTAEERRELLERLTAVESFERFLHTVFAGQRRFSIEGNDMLVPMLDHVIDDAARQGTEEILIGMAHRGRLNVLAHVLGKPYKNIFAEFHSTANREVSASDASSRINLGWTGDVKYHLGAQRTIREGEQSDVKVTLADNPSHLEFVAPVVEGFARAAQEDRDHPGLPSQDPDRALAVTIHGDAAFPGEGVVAETLNLSRLPGYQTGGTIRIITNNQLGYTTLPGDGRSTLYASDLAKGFEIPIVHVNADDPEACIAAVRLAHAYRERFKKDFLIDLVGYRRWGHNEGDEPAFTQPELYAKIMSHPTVRQIYAERLMDEGVITEDEANDLQQHIRKQLQEARESKSSADKTETGQGRELHAKSEFAAPLVSEETLQDLNEALLEFPDGFTLNPKLDRAMARRRTGVDTERGIDWAHAESLAFASILAVGTPIRMSGQDTERGTFSQRHLVLHDPKTGASYTPLQHIPRARASFAVYNSPLSESAVLGFEYGYSVHAPDAMVLWEAQFGDFANVGQVLIDQFIASARAKWLQCSSLVLLLPHGYEGQGPEHSSARLERYLQLAAEDNLRVANCTTAAQYFHLLRAQAASLDGRQRPLVVMTPKSLLRNPRAASSLADLAHGTFRPVLDDVEASRRRQAVERLLVCSGKIAFDLETASTEASERSEKVAVVRIEQLYPFPAEAVERIVGSYPDLRDVVWVQEEPQNMGAWSFVAPRLRSLLPEAVPLLYVGRPERASTAEGSGDAHSVEQARIIREALSTDTRAKIQTHGGHDAS